MEAYFQLIQALQKLQEFLITLLTQARGLTMFINSLQQDQQLGME